MKRNPKIVLLIIQAPILPGLSEQKIQCSSSFDSFAVDLEPNSLPCPRHIHLDAPQS